MFKSFLMISEASFDMVKLISKIHSDHLESRLLFKIICKNNNQTVFKTPLNNCSSCYKIWERVG